MFFESLGALLPGADVDVAPTLRARGLADDVERRLALIRKCRRCRLRSARSVGEGSLRCSVTNRFERVEQVAVLVVEKFGNAAAWPAGFAGVAGQELLCGTGIAEDVDDSGRSGDRRTTEGGLDPSLEFVGVVVLLERPVGGQSVRHRMACQLVESGSQTRRADTISTDSASSHADRSALSRSARSSMTLTT